VFENRIHDVWNFYLPLVQRIPNYSVDGSIGTRSNEPARVIFGDVETSDIASIEMGNYGARTLRLRVLRQAFIHILGKQFIVRTDHKNLVYSANSTVLKLVNYLIGIQISYQTHPGNI